MTGPKQFSQSELNLLIRKFVIPFLSINNVKLDDKIEFHQLDEVSNKNFIEYNMKAKVMNFYPSNNNSLFKLSLKCEFNKKIKNIRDVFDYVLKKKESYDAKFVESYFDFLIEEGLSNWLSLRKDDLFLTIQTIIKSLKKWTLKTFEGKKKSFVIGINTNDYSNNQDGQNIKDIIDNPYFATITEAYNSAIVVNRNGTIIEYISDAIPNTDNDDVDYVLPTKCASIVKQLHKSNCDIVISLEENGDLLIFNTDYKGSKKETEGKQVKPQVKTVLAYRSGQWLNYDAVNLKNVIHKKGDEENINELFTAILDVSLEHSGGSIAIVDESKDINGLYEILSDIDNLDKPYEYQEHTNDKEQKRKLIEKLLTVNGKKENFFTMDKHKRLELLSMDGATIINKNGRIIAVGAIIKGVEPSDDGGGRTASVRKLSEFGKAIKISTDGGISVYINKLIKYKM